MNIFALDINPKLAAKYHVDKHVVKMIVESTQMLMSYYRIYTKIENEFLYKLTHKNHPCTKWVNESLSNWKWLFELLKYLNYEWKKRFKHKKNHISFEKLKYILRKYKYPKIKDIGLTKFVLAMPEQYKSKDSVVSYRKYYLYKIEKLKVHSYKYLNILNNSK